MESKRNKSNGIIIIIVSIVVLFANSGGLFAASVISNVNGEEGEVPKIFFIICITMIILGVAGLGYGFWLRSKK